MPKPEVATCTATNSDYATCGLKRELSSGKKRTRTFPKHLLIASVKNALVFNMNSLMRMKDYVGTCPDDVTIRDDSKKRLWS